MDKPLTTRERFKANPLHCGKNMLTIAAYQKNKYMRVGYYCSKCHHLIADVTDGVLTSEVERKEKKRLLDIQREKLLMEKHRNM